MKKLTGVAVMIGITKSKESHPYEYFPVTDAKGDCYARAGLGWTYDPSKQSWDHRENIRKVLFRENDVVSMILDLKESKLMF